MSSSEKRIRTSKRNFILALILLLITNILMGVTLMILSRISLRQQIDQRMLDIANTAAYQLDGDALKDLKAEDKGTDDYEKALAILRAFQQNIIFTVSEPSLTAALRSPLTPIRSIRVNSVPLLRQHRRCRTPQRVQQI